MKTNTIPPLRTTLPTGFKESAYTKLTGKIQQIATTFFNGIAAMWEAAKNSIFCCFPKNSPPLTMEEQEIVKKIENALTSFYSDKPKQIKENSPDLLTPDTSSKLYQMYLISVAKQKDPTIAPEHTKYIPRIEISKIIEDAERLSAK